MGVIGPFEESRQALLMGFLLTRFRKRSHWVYTLLCASPETPAAFLRVLAMAAKGSISNPHTGTPTELRRVGVVVFSRREQSLKCVRCEAVWKMAAWLHKRPRKYWVCPNGCNAPS